MDIPYTDNSNCVMVIDSHVSVFAILNEVCYILVIMFRISSIYESGFITSLQLTSVYRQLKTVQPSCL